MNDSIEKLQAVFAALRFAAERHRLQRRKGVEDTPYVNHLIAVVDLLVDVGGIDDVEVLMAGVLHDTIEDTETRGEEIERHFGARVRGVVEEVTDDKSLPKDERKRLQVAHARDISREAKLVKLADKISNVTDVCDCPPGDWSCERRLAYVDWAQEVVDGLRGVNAKLERRFDEAAAHARSRIDLRSE
jgi:guanosine-3',5'-bis(diphosphate) 3'-pyrophosphohydrolase